MLNAWIFGQPVKNGICPIYIVMRQHKHPIKAGRKVVRDPFRRIRAVIAHASDAENTQICLLPPRFPRFCFLIGQFRKQSHPNLIDCSQFVGNESQNVRA